MSFYLWVLIGGAIGINKSTSFKSAWGGIITIMLFCLLSYYAYLIVSNPLSYDRSVLYNDESNENNSWLNGNWATTSSQSDSSNLDDTPNSSPNSSTGSGTNGSVVSNVTISSGNGSSTDPEVISEPSLGDDSGVSTSPYEINEKYIYFPYQYESYPSFIHFNTTQIYPQKEGFQFAAKLSNGLKGNESSMYIEFRLVTKTDSGDIYINTLETEVWTASHFNQSCNYLAENWLSQLYLDPLQDIDLTEYLWPTKSDIAFYSNSNGKNAQYIEVVAKMCDQNTQSNWASVSDIKAEFKDVTLDILYVNMIASNYGILIKQAVTEYSIPAIPDQQSLMNFEIIPTYVDPNNWYGSYTFYQISKQHSYSLPSASLETAKIKFELSSQLLQSFKGYFTLYLPKVRRLNDDQVNSSESKSENLLPSSYFILYVLSQIGGLMYFFKTILSTILSYFNSKIFKHEIVNSWIKLNQLKSLETNFIKLNHDLNRKTTPSGNQVVPFKKMDESFEEEKQLCKTPQNGVSEASSISKSFTTKTSKIKNLKHRSSYAFSKKYEDIVRTSGFTTTDLMYDIFWWKFRQSKNVNSKSYKIKLLNDQFDELKTQLDAVQLFQAISNLQHQVTLLTSDRSLAKPGSPFDLKPGENLWLSKTIDQLHENSESSSNKEKTKYHFQTPTSSTPISKYQPKIVAQDQVITSERIPTALIDVRKNILKIVDSSSSGQGDLRDTKKM